jgi:NDP-sugar pyrophosphorylase family protein
MILAAGRGTRLGPLGASVPKVLVEVAGEPLLARHLRHLEGQGVDRVVVNAHHLADRVEAFLAGYRGPLQVCCLIEERLLGTAGGVRNALPLLEPGPFAVVYGDIILDEPLAPLLATHRHASALATLGVHVADDVKGKGVVELDSGGRVIAFLEKAGSGRKPAFISSGIYIVESELVRELPTGMELDFGHDVFPGALDRGLPLFAHRLSRPVIDVGTLEGLALARTQAGTPRG